MNNYIMLASKLLVYITYKMATKLQEISFNNL